MVASIAASAFFPIPSSSSSVASITHGERSDSLDARGVVAKPGASVRGIKVKVNAQAVPKINGTKLGVKTETPRTVADLPSIPPRTFYNQLPDWSMLLAAIMTIFLAAEKQWALPDWKLRRPDMLSDDFAMGRIVGDGLVFRQNFSIRSYEIGADRTANIETLMNHLQESALNHVRCAGLMGDGFGSTPEMARRSLIWVVTKMQVIMEQYPSWGDIVEVDTWVGASGKNGMRRDWHVRDCRTGQTIMKATSVWVMMNKHTRKLSKIPKEVRTEIGQYFVEHSAIVDDGKKLCRVDDNTAQYVRRDLTPQWSDLDVNQHVNNVKYIGWILEGAPISILESHELGSMTLEYRRECRKDSNLQSLSALSHECSDAGWPEDRIECDHMLRLECGSEVVRGRTEWRPKLSRHLLDPIPS